MPQIDIFSAETVEEFVKNLNETIALGWVPQGSPFVHDDKINIMLVRVDANDIIGIGGTA